MDDCVNGITVVYCAKAICLAGHQSCTDEPCSLAMPLALILGLVLYRVSGVSRFLGFQKLLSVWGC